MQLSLTDRLRALIALRPEMSAPRLIVAVLAWIVVVDNTALWQRIVERLDGHVLQGAGYMGALGLLMMLILYVLLQVVTLGPLLKPALLTLLGVSGAISYFSNQLGIVFDVEMLRNMAETVRDRNSQEAAELVSLSLLGHLALTVLPPALFVLWCRVAPAGVVRATARRLGWGVALGVLATVMVFANFRYVTYFSRENNDLEVYLNPLYPAKSLERLVRRSHAGDASPFVALGLDAVQPTTAHQRTVGIMVVGETTRADHVGLNGYSRDTMPQLRKRDIINFPSTTSCGTSTAYSVPCMFSLLTADSYSPEAAASQSNVLDVLDHAGVHSVWVDINSSCKGVCGRIDTINLTQQVDADSPLYVDGAWQDGILIGEVERLLDASDPEQDLLLVLHVMGSHGPAYYRRVPESYRRYAPYCASTAPQDCSSEEIVNAYDNTIVYEDQVLAALVDRLAARGNERNFLLYASDHGESLGEGGVYLHGLPRLIAPQSQTHVPMLVWLGDSLRHELLPDAPRELQAQNDLRPVSHDNLSATLLGLYDVNTTVYDAGLDLFANPQQIVLEPVVDKRVADLSGLPAGRQ